VWCFAGVFAKNGCANLGFLRGKRGEVVVNCVAGSDSKSALKNGTGVSVFSSVFSRIFWLGLVEIGQVWLSSSQRLGSGGGATLSE
jgi:hypothetical protein